MSGANSLTDSKLVQAAICHTSVIQSFVRFLTESMASMNSGKAARTPLLPAALPPPFVPPPPLPFGLFVLP